MMNYDEYDKIIEECKILSQSKNSDYSDEPLLKFREKGIIVRMTDKMCRMTNLIWNNNNISIKDEHIEDTARDIINYAIYLIMMQNKKL